MTPEIEADFRSTVASLLPSRLIDQGEVERETAMWIRTMRRALNEE